MDFNEIQNKLGSPASYPQETREAVARLVAEPLETGTPVEDLLDALEEDLDILLDQWLTGDPDYPITEALTVTQLACDFARFAIRTRTLAATVPDQALPALITVVDALEAAGIVSGDWSWCLSVADYLIAAGGDIDNGEPATPSAS
jgi:hypothetical protein